MTSSGLVEGQVASTEKTVSRTTVGTVEYIIEANEVVIKNGETDVSANYDITTISGTLRISPVVVIATPTPTPLEITPTPSATEIPVMAVETPSPAPSTTPSQQVEIEDDNIPFAAADNGNSWALLNLLLTILTGLISITLLITYFTGKDKKDDDEQVDDEQDKDNIKRKGIWRIISLLPIIAMIWIFILTENMSNPMVIVDKYTVLMAIITLVQILIAFISRKKEEEKQEQTEQ